jgi:hypothetical protein
MAWDGKPVMSPTISTAVEPSSAPEAAKTLDGDVPSNGNQHPLGEQTCEPTQYRFKKAFQVSEMEAKTAGRDCGEANATRCRLQYD